MARSSAPRFLLRLAAGLAVAAVVFAVLVAIAGRWWLAGAAAVASAALLLAARGLVDRAISRAA